jgi:hypothetical protein
MIKLLILIKKTANSIYGALMPFVKIIIHDIEIIIYSSKF